MVDSENPRARNPNLGIGPDILHGNGGMENTVSLVDVGERGIGRPPRQKLILNPSLHLAEVYTCIGKKSTKYLKTSEYLDQRNKDYKAVPGVFFWHSC